jgi:hypothetical protein
MEVCLLMADIKSKLLARVRVNKDFSVVKSCLTVYKCCLSDVSCTVRSHVSKLIKLHFAWPKGRLI